MRTTVDLPEELLRTAKALAENRGQTMSRVIADLVSRGLQHAPVKYATKNGFPLLPPSPTGGTVTLEHVRELEELDDVEMAKGMHR